MQDTVYCTGCGAALVKEICHYCGTENYVYFITKEELYEIQRSPGYIWSLTQGSSFTTTYFGKTVCIKN